MRTFSRRLVSLLGLLLACASSQAMDNADLIKLKESGFSDDTILLTIDRQPAEFNTSPDALVALKKAGISDKVIDRVLARTADHPAPPPPPPPAPVAQVAPAAAPPATQSIPAIPSGALFNIDSPSIAPEFIQPEIGKDYFTRFTFHVEGTAYSTTNYSRGDLVPINTPVNLVSMSTRRIALKRLDTNATIIVENVEKYSKKTVPEFARLLLSAKKTPIDRLVPELSKAILDGEMRKGMTKEQVLMARGYPPGHETPSEESDRWVYWSSRFIKQTIIFSNGRLVDGRGID